MVGISLYKSETLRVEFYKFGWILSSTVWWWRWRWWREETETTHKAPSLGSTALQSHVVQLHSVIIISISLSSPSHLTSISSPLKSQFQFQSVPSFQGSPSFELLSLPARRLAGSLLIALIFTIISFIVMLCRGTMLHRALYRAFVWSAREQDLVLELELGHGFINQKCSAYTT